MLSFGFMTLIGIIIIIIIIIFHEKCTPLHRRTIMIIMIADSYNCDYNYNL